MDREAKRQKTWQRQLKAKAKAAKAAAAKAPGAPSSKAAGETPSSRSPPTEAEIKEATQKAIAMVELGIKKNRGVQESGHRWIPLCWAKEMKPVLGPYKKFVETCPHFRVEPGDTPEKYTVHLRNGDASSSAPAWKLDIQRAWENYCLATPKEERNVADFVEMASAVAKKELAGSESAAAAPKKRGADTGSAAASAPKKKKKKAES